MSKNVRFTVVKIVAKPAMTVKFTTKSGERVSFKALKTVKQKEVVHFRAKEKMKRIYLDSNVLIAHHSVDKAEEAEKEDGGKCL